MSNFAPCPFCGCEPIFDKRKMTLSCSQLECAIYSISVSQETWEHLRNLPAIESFVDDSEDLQRIYDTESSIDERMSYHERAFIAFYRTFSEFVNANHA